jgi:hypothetical protein
MGARVTTNVSYVYEYGHLTAMALVQGPNARSNRCVVAADGDRRCRILATHSSSRQSVNEEQGEDDTINRQRPRSMIRTRTGDMSCRLNT